MSEFIDPTALMHRAEWLKTNGILMKQNMRELEILFGTITMLQQGRALNGMIELGVLQGGSMYMLAGLLAPGAVIIGVDAPLRDSHDQKPELRQRVLDKLKEEGFEVHFVNKTTKEGLEDVRVLLKGRLLQFLHIDAGHDAANARFDFKSYRDFVEHYILFHDIRNNHWRRRGGIPVLWESWRTEHPHVEILGKSSPGMGLLLHRMT